MLLIEYRIIPFGSLKVGYTSKDMINLSGSSIKGAFKTALIRSLNTKGYDTFGRDSIISEIFGIPGKMGRVIFRDAVPVDENYTIEGIEDEKKGEEKNKKKSYIYFRGELASSIVCEEKYIPYIYEAMNEINAYRVMLGIDNNSGYGFCKLKIQCIKELTIDGAELNIGSESVEQLSKINMPSRDFLSYGYSASDDVSGTITILYDIYFDVIPEESLLEKMNINLKRIIMAILKKKHYNIFSGIFKNNRAFIISRFVQENESVKCVVLLDNMDFIEAKSVISVIHRKIHFRNDEFPATLSFIPSRAWKYTVDEHEKDITAKVKLIV